MHHRTSPNTACRPRDHVVTAGRLYPAAWKQADSMHAGRGLDLPDWPSWCYLPIAATIEIVAADAGVDASRLHLSHPECAANGLHGRANRAGW